jgi:hypothetical protein
MNRSCSRHTHGFDTPARRIAGYALRLAAAKIVLLVAALKASESAKA